jgi:hypothetical protein
VLHASGWWGHSEGLQNGRSGAASRIEHGERCGCNCGSGQCSAARAVPVPALELQHLRTHSGLDAGSFGYCLMQQVGLQFAVRLTTLYGCARDVTYDAPPTPLASPIVLTLCGMHYNALQCALHCTALHCRTYTHRQRRRRKPEWVHECAF